MLGCAYFEHILQGTCDYVKKKEEDVKENIYERLVDRYPDTKPNKNIIIWTISCRVGDSIEYLKTNKQWVWNQESNCILTTY
jgi:hypothetical protein